jgi:modulator of FtsH protease HflC
LEDKNMNKIGLIISSLLIGVAVLASTLFVVDQRQFGVLYSFGQIKEVITEPGLRFKLPQPFQNVVFLDRRVLTLDSPETGSIQTAEKKNLVVDWLVKWRIADPKQFIRNNSGGATISTAEQRLTSVVQDALNSEVTKRTVKDVLSTDRDKIMQGVQQRLVDDAKTFGIEIVDVRIKRVDFPASVADSVYQRMKSERQQVANELRSTGGAEGEKIRADADRQRDVLVAEAYRDAQKVKGEGDAKASAIYAESFGRDPQFAQFYRSLDAYKASFSKKSDVLVLDPNSSEFFKTMRNGGSSAGSAPKSK